MTVYLCKNPTRKGFKPFRQAKVTLICDNCGVLFARWRSNVLPAPHYCGHACYQVARAKLRDPVPSDTVRTRT